MGNKLDNNENGYSANFNECMNNCEQKFRINSIEQDNNYRQKRENAPICEMTSYSQPQNVNIVNSPITNVHAVPSQTAVFAQQPLSINAIKPQVGTTFYISQPTSTQSIPSSPYKNVQPTIIQQKPVITSPIVPSQQYLIPNNAIQMIQPNQIVNSPQKLITTERGKPNTESKMVGCQIIPADMIQSQTVPDLNQPKIVKIEPSNITKPNIPQNICDEQAKINSTQPTIIQDANGKLTINGNNQPLQLIVPQNNSPNQIRTQPESIYKQSIQPQETCVQPQQIIQSSPIYVQTTPSGAIYTYPAQSVNSFLPNQSLSPKNSYQPEVIVQPIASCDNNANQTPKTEIIQYTLQNSPFNTTKPNYLSNQSNPRIVEACDFKNGIEYINVPITTYEPVYDNKNVIRNVQPDNSTIPNGICSDTMEISKVNNKWLYTDNSPDAPIHMNGKDVEFQYVDGDRCGNPINK